MRIGLGFDIHPFAPGRRLVIGGVEIDHTVGLAGHSDADVLLHAIGDALLGAAALGDIGQHFPPSDPQYRDISSLVLLGRVRCLVEEAGYTIGNVDASVIAEGPKLSPHYAGMRQRIADCLGIGMGQVSVKATTAEGLGTLGRGEGMAAFAVATLIENPTSQQHRPGIAVPDL